MNIVVWRTTNDANEIIDRDNALRYCVHLSGENKCQKPLDTNEDVLSDPGNRRIMQMKAFQNCQFPCYLAHTADGYGLALLATYGKSFADANDLQMDELFDTVIRDAEALSKFGVCDNCVAYVIQGADNARHELVLWMPNTTSWDDAEVIGNLMKLAVYNQANLLVAGRRMIRRKYTCDVYVRCIVPVVVETSSMEEARKLSVEKICAGQKIKLIEASCVTVHKAEA